MLKSEQLFSHALVKLAMKNLEPVTEQAGKDLIEVAKATGKLRTDKASKIPSKFDYDLRVFWKLAFLLDTTRRLENVELFLKKFPQPKTYTKQGITQDTWIEYHFATHILSMVGLWDMALILTNEVFRLGFPERLCKSDTILSNHWIRVSPVSECLRELKKFVQPLKTMRNLHIHRGESPQIHEIINSERYDDLRLVAFVKLHSDLDISEHLINSAFSMEVEKLIVVVREQRDQLFRHLSNLFDALLPIYKSH